MCCSVCTYLFLGERRNAEQPIDSLNSVNRINKAGIMILGCVFVIGAALIIIAATAHLSASAQLGLHISGGITPFVSWAIWRVIKEIYTTSPESPSRTEIIGSLVEDEGEFEQFLQSNTLRDLALKYLEAAKQHKSALQRDDTHPNAFSLLEWGQKYYLLGIKTDGHNYTFKPYDYNAKDVEALDVRCKQLLSKGYLLAVRGWTDEVKSGEIFKPSCLDA